MAIRTSCREAEQPSLDIPRIVFERVKKPQGRVVRFGFTAHDELLRLNSDRQGSQNSLERVLFTSRLHQQLYRWNNHVAQDSLGLFCRLKRLHCVCKRACVGGAMSFEIIERLQADGCNP